MKQKILCLTLLAALKITAGYSQQIGGTQPDPKMLPNGEGAATGISGIYSPSLYDGTLNVNIPIYAYSAEGVNLGVSLSYNTRGVKLDEISSTVGLHWNLAAEGSVTRIVKGYPDEMNKVVDNIYLDGQYYTQVKGRLACSFENSSQAADPAMLRDQESDDFIVNAGGLSFTFNIGTQRAILVRPSRGVQVEVLYNGQPISDAIAVGSPIPDPLALSFRITDEQGNRYYFEKGDWLQDRLSTQLEAGSWVYSTFYSYITRWVVTKITLANGMEIAYTYNTHYMTTAGYRSGSAMESAAPGSVYGNPPAGSPVIVNGYVSDIAAIAYPNGTGVTFNYETDVAKKRCDVTQPIGNPSMALREIVVSGGGTNGIRYKLQQSYDVVKMWNNTATGSISYGTPCVDIYTVDIDQTVHMDKDRSHRLKLDGITLSSYDGSVEEPYYSFEYDATPMPLRMRGTQDFFGYYNNTLPILNELSIPSHTSIQSPYQVYGQNCNSDLSGMKAEVLTAVKNAYGGKVTFAYQLHAGLQNVMTNLPSDPDFLGKDAADGLRLLSITESDVYHPVNSKVTSFQYSGGQFFLNGGYFHYPAYYENATSANVPVIHFTSNFMTAHQLINGANHGYSNVTVLTQALNNGVYTDLGKKSFEFTNFQDASSGNQPRYLLNGAGSKDFFTFPYTDKQYIKDWEMGLPLSVKEYDENGLLTIETANTYTFSTDLNSAAAKGVLNTKVSFANYLGAPTVLTGPPDNFSFPDKRKITDSYAPYSGKALLQQTTVKKYVSDTRYISDATSYVYDSHDNLKKILTGNSEGDQTETINYYNYDLVTNNGGGPFIPMSGLERLVGTQRWQLPAGSSGTLPDDGVLLDGYFNGLTWESNGTVFSKIWSKFLYNLYTGAPLSYSQYLGSGPYNTTTLKALAAIGGNELPGFIRTSEVARFDEKGNPLETLLPGQQYKAMIWDKYTGQKLAEATNCRQDDLYYTSFEEGWEALAAYTTSGNFGYYTGGVTTNTGFSGGGPVSGSKAYRLHSGTGATDLSSGGALRSNVTYRLSFWAKGTTPPKVMVGSSQIYFSSDNDVHTKGDWHNYQIDITSAAGGMVTFSSTGSDIYIDEVRICPLAASMQSYTYEPLFGISSSTDVSGRISYQEYDKLGRQTLVRDQDGNILSKTVQVVQGQD